MLRVGDQPDDDQRHQGDEQHAHGDGAARPSARTDRTSARARRVLGGGASFGGGGLHGWRSSLRGGSGRGGAAGRGRGACRPQGITRRVRSVELTSPPMTAMAMGARSSAPSPAHEAGRCPGRPDEPAGQGDQAQHGGRRGHQDRAQSGAPRPRGSTAWTSRAPPARFWFDRGPSSTIALFTTIPASRISADEDDHGQGHLEHARASRIDAHSRPAGTLKRIIEGLQQGLELAWPSRRRRGRSPAGARTAGSGCPRPARASGRRGSTVDVARDGRRESDQRPLRSRCVDARPRRGPRRSRRSPARRRCPPMRRISAGPCGAPRCVATADEGHGLGRPWG